MNLKLQLPPTLTKFFKHSADAGALSWHQPRLDWALALGAAGLLSIIFLCVAGYLYWLAGQEPSVELPVPAGERFNEKQLQDTVSFYEHKRLQFEDPEFLGQPPADPSR